MSFWDDIERHIADVEEGGGSADPEVAPEAVDDTGAPDPWADLDLGAAALTDEQVEFLADPGDQPPVPRLTDPGRAAGEHDPG
jgi:hypothetical protein